MADEVSFGAGKGARTLFQVVDKSLGGDISFHLSLFLSFQWLIDE
jgi:hypothetical protein